MHRRPVIYFGGKIGPRDFRHKLVWEVRGAAFGELIERPEFIYGGPYFISCDHGCSHGANTHGLAASVCEVGPMRERVPALCRQWLARCDLMLAWIEAADAYGTLVEIGWAQQMGKPVRIGFATKRLAREMWFLSHGPHTSAIVCRSVDDVLRSALLEY